MYSRECYIRCNYFHLYSRVCDIICSWLKLNPNLFEGCCLRGVTGTLTPDSSFLPPPCSTWARRRRPTTCSFRPQEAFLRFFFQIETHTHTRQSWKNIFLFLCRIYFLLYPDTFNCFNLKIEMSKIRSTIFFIFILTDQISVL